MGFVGSLRTNGEKEGTVETVVSVSGGKVRGVVREGVYAFLGIPYAAPAVGAARFELPKPVEKWVGVRDAVTYGATCPQGPYPDGIQALVTMNRVPGDEYLNLNVWTPDPGTSGLPVLVWIHGGGYSRGSNAGAVADGSAFARDGVVVVSMNYRVGMAGFAVLDGAPANRGLHDQIFALRWVQENVAAFGGDPGNVTLGGLSAGGMSVAALLASPLAQGLFRRAIIQNGTTVAAAPMDDARKLSAAAAAKLGIEPSATAFGALEEKELLDAQEAVALDQMIDPSPERWGASFITNGIGILNFFPVVDGEMLTDTPLKVLEAQPDRALPLLCGYAAEEFRFFLMPTGVAAAVTAETLPFFLSRYGMAPELADVFAANRPSATPADLLAAVFTDVAFRADIVRFAEACAHAPTFVYEFAWPSGVDGLGACHALETAFIFDRLASAHAITGPNPPQPLADEMHRAWVDFVINGDPGWQRFDAATRPVRVFDHPELQLVYDPRAEELRAARR